MAASRNRQFLATGVVAPGVSSGSPFFGMRRVVPTDGPRLGRVWQDDPALASAERRIFGSLQNAVLAAGIEGRDGGA